MLQEVVPTVIQGENHRMSAAFSLKTGYPGPALVNPFAWEFPQEYPHKHHRRWVENPHEWNEPRGVRRGQEPQ